MDRYSEGESQSFSMDIYLGKKTNLLDLKKNIVQTISKQLVSYKESRTKLYFDSELELVNKCPVCGSSSRNVKPVVNIYGADYVQCNNCTHIYIIKRPAKKAISNFYLNDINYASTYTDKESAKKRLDSIAVPWLEWVIKVYEKKYGKQPESILDIGSGAGHFIEACRRRGIRSNGIELSKSSRKFAKEIWGIELDGVDFLETLKKYEGYDIVTFWGLLEHTTNPSSLLQKAWDIVSKSSNGGMVISKLPRWNSLTSAIQRICPETIIRHLDPMGHIMAFTDTSASEIYYQNSFKPIAAWYYGMDIYEVLMQIGNKIGSYEHLTKSGKIQIELQQYLDEAAFSDGLTLVGVPF